MAPGSLAGRIIAIDPGHNGGNSANPGIINAQVPAGGGQMKACDTAGTSTDAGYTEHEFTWDVSRRLRTLLEAAGATVVMTRADDASVGPCVDVRGSFAQAQGADLKISIHGDGSTNKSLHGFFAIVASPPLNDAQSAPSITLANDIIASLQAAGFTPNSSYPGGLSKRSDLAGLNLSERPSVLVELGEMRNPGDAAVMSSPDGRQRYADALADAVGHFLGG